ncbi:MAG: hypothetical protein P1S60_17510 [Anaerolineae bacterium]|nr:hypothetical protein [Anaerolineae bacterium]
MAQHIIPFGWGEGSGFASHILNRDLLKPEEFTLLSGDIPGVASLFKGHTVPKTAENSLCAEGLVSREVPDFGNYTPAKVISISGLHLTTIHTQTNRFPPGTYLAAGPIAGLAPTTVAPRTTPPPLKTMGSRTVSR